MNWVNALLSGFLGTIALTTIMAGSQSLRFTRMNVPFMIGTIFTPDRDRAKLVGVIVHFLNGWWITLIYSALFETWDVATWWLGAILGLVHALFLLIVVMPVVPGLHPRMASEERGPTPTKQLEPPGFLALNYGRRTPISIILAHLVYGAIIGALNRPS